MMRRNSLSMMALVAVAWLLTSCSTMPRHETASTVSSETMYQVLVADMAARRGQYDLAGDTYRGLAGEVQDPRMAELSVRLAFLAGDMDRAVKAARLWMELAPEKPETRQYLAAALIRNGDWESAAEHIEKLLQAPPGQAPTEQQLAIVATLLTAERDKTAARKFVERALVTGKNDAVVQYTYGALALTLEEVAMAERAAARALEIKPQWLNGLFLKTRVLLLTGQTEAALQLLKDTTARHPEALGLQQVYANELIKQERIEEAFPVLQALAQAAPENATVVAQLVAIAIDLKRLDDADRYLTLLETTAKAEKEARFYRGVVAEMRGQPEAALKAYANVTEGANYLSAQLRAANLIADQGTVDAALALVRALRTRSDAQNRPRILRAESDILRTAKRSQEAYDILTQGLQEFPNDIDMLYSRAMVSENLGRLDWLERDLLAILKITPDNATALNALGYTLVDLTDRYQEGADYIARALKIRPNDHAILDSMGWAYFRLKQYPQAIEYLQRSWDLQPDPEVGAHLGEALWVSGDQKAARAQWQRAKALGIENETLTKTLKRFGQE